MWDFENIRFRCDSCGIEKLAKEMDCFKCFCGGNMIIAEQLHGFKINGRFYGSGICKPDRKGYHPEIDDPQTEIRADMEALEDKAMRTTNLKKHRELTRALKSFEFAHKQSGML
ncbi:MAG: hypothetical protein ACOZAL_02885 [Patescibacteria group bacterium]